MEPTVPHPLTTRPAAYVVWIAWVIAAITIFTMVVVRDHGQPNFRTPRHGPHSVYFVYPRATDDWWHSRNVYDVANNDDFQYLPQAAILHTPFWLLGEPAGDIAWRAAGIALLLGGIWRLSEAIKLPDGGKAFPVIALLSLAPSLASLQNGQANLHLAGLMLHAALDLGQQRWWRAAIVLSLAVAIKQTAIPMLLLAGAVYPRLRWRLAVAVLVMVALPFLTQSWSYAGAQYDAAILKMAGAIVPERNTWEWTELHDAIGKLTGWNMPRPVLFGIEMSAAVLSFVFCALAVNRLNALASALFLWAMATCYIMLFNPRNESNSYVIVTPVVAASVILAAMQRREILKWFLIATTIGFSCDGWAHRQTNPWLKPVLCAIFLVIVVTELFRKPGLLQGANPAPPAPVPPNPQQP